MIVAKEPVGEGFVRVYFVDHALRKALGEDRLHVLRRIDLEDRLQVFISVKCVDESARDNLSSSVKSAPYVSLRVSMMAERVSKSSSPGPVMLSTARDFSSASFLISEMSPSDVWLIRNESMFTMSWMNVGNSNPGRGVNERRDE